MKSLGDGTLAVFDGPARAIHGAEAIRTGLNDLEISVRTGVHTGECGLIGDDIGGMAVHIGARVGALAEADEILVSRAVADLVVGSGLRFTDRESGRDRRDACLTREVRDRRALGALGVPVVAPASLQARD